MQAESDGKIERVRPFEDDATILVCNRDGKLDAMEGNRRLNGDVIVGPFFIIRDDRKGGMIDLTGGQVQRYAERFAEPENITQNEVQDAM